MSREKMIPKPPLPDKAGATPFEKFTRLARRLVNVPKTEVVKPKRKHR